MLRLAVVVGLACLVTSQEDAARNVYLTAQNIQEAGYHVETHHAVTEDGYVIGMHRIPYPRHQTSPREGTRPVVLVMHGLTAASNAFILLGPELSPAYNLADAGCDVWLGNSRGNKHSRVHQTLDPDQEPLQFFDFSWEEIGYYDVAAMVEYILQYTGRDRLHYVGHSQGGTAFLVLTSMRPQYNAKVASAQLLAGVGYKNYFPDPAIVQFAAMTDLIYSLALSMGMLEVFPPNTTFDGTTTTTRATATRLDYCLGDLLAAPICEAIGLRQVRNDLDLEVLFSSNDYSGGGSLKQIAHYGQNIRDQQFRRYHHGTAQNQALYGSPDPPLYDISRVTVNTTMHYSLNDTLLGVEDVYAMVADMPNTVARRVARESFSHTDFLIAEDAKELVTDYVIEAILYVEENVDFDQVVTSPPDSGEVEPAPAPAPESDPENVPDVAHQLTLSHVLICMMVCLLRC